MKVKTEEHHVIPISLTGHDKPYNKIRLVPADHEVLHEEQFVPARVLRRWKEKTNHILMPNEFTEHERLRILKMYFDKIANNPSYVVLAQLRSILGQQQKQVSLEGHPRNVAIEILESQTQERINFITKKR